VPAASTQKVTSTVASRLCHLPMKYWCRLMPRLSTESAIVPRSPEMLPEVMTTTSVMLPSSVQRSRSAISFDAGWTIPASWARPKR
jgi:hypothetical protein